MALARVPALRARQQRLAAGQGGDRRERADDEPVVRQHEGVGVQPHHRGGARARGDLASLERRHPGEVLRRAVVEPHLVAGAQRPGAGQDRDPRVEAAPGHARRARAPPASRRARCRRGRDREGSRPRGCPRAPPRSRGRAPGRCARRRARRRARRPSRPRRGSLPDHRVPVTTVPMPLSGKTRSTGRRAGPARRPASADPAARSSAASRSSRPRPSRALTVTTSLAANGVPSRNSRTSSSGQLEQLLVDQVRLGQRDDAPAHAEQLDDRQVLDGLRHDAVVGGDDEEEQVDAGRAGDHGAHEALVTGDVDDAEPRARRQLELRVPELDGDAALALLAEPVGVLAGEPGDERRLAVVDVAGGAESQRRRGHERAPRSAHRPSAAIRHQRCRASAPARSSSSSSRTARRSKRRRPSCTRQTTAGSPRRSCSARASASAAGHRGRDRDAGHLGDRQRAGAGAGDRLDELETVLGHAGADEQVAAAARRGRGRRSADCARAPPASGSRRRRGRDRGRAAGRRRARRGRACRCARPAPAGGGASPRWRRPGRRRCRPAGRPAACRR